MLAGIFEKAGDLGGGVRALEDALSYEPRLDARSSFRPHLRRWVAHLREASGAPSSEVIDLLISAAALWYDILAGPLGPQDFSVAADTMHDDFRVLADRLIRHGRTTEALLAVEASRALLHAALIDRPGLLAVLTSNPFHSDGRIDCSVIRRVQEVLTQEDVLVTLAVLPAGAAAFVIDRNDVKVVVEPIPSQDRTAFTLVSTRLQEGKGLAGLPGSALRLAEQIKGVIGENAVRAVVPYGILHSIPWRTVLRSTGMEWKKLAFQVEFGILLRSSVHACPSGIPSTVALGYGKSGSGADFAEEASDFANKCGPRSTCSEGTRSAVMASLLSGSDIVLLSFHGKAIYSALGVPRVLLARLLMVNGAAMTCLVSL